MLQPGYQCTFLSAVAGKIPMGSYDSPSLSLSAKCQVSPVSGPGRQGLPVRLAKQGVQPGRDTVDQRGLKLRRLGPIAPDIFLLLCAPGAQSSAREQLGEVSCI